MCRKKADGGLAVAAAITVGAVAPAVASEEEEATKVASAEAAVAVGSLVVGGGRHREVRFGFAARMSSSMGVGGRSRVIVCV